ncbi:hypothetical protein RchiOBHm_Chr3g0478911 [Rosa chinensis]|uniref:Uncharacterized protein n=1 Tax=Rosa chinensis TaxID=74649 RepID=A0A2P6RDB1_ROSCH|nr:hypothetical protein RchiOBHm_Chr3g0478911 [Rosa chinensis]
MLSALRSSSLSNSCWKSNWFTQEMSYMILALIVSTRPKLEGTVADGEASNSESRLIWWFRDRLKKASGVF